MGNRFLIVNSKTPIEFMKNQQGFIRLGNNMIGLYNGVMHRVEKNELVPLCDPPVSSPSTVAPPTVAPPTVAPPTVAPPTTSFNRCSAFIILPENEEVGGIHSCPALSNSGAAVCGAHTVSTVGRDDKEEKKREREEGDEECNKKEMDVGKPLQKRTKMIDSIKQ